LSVDEVAKAAISFIALPDQTGQTQIVKGD
jgi:hypothetical protein